MTWERADPIEHGRNHQSKILRRVAASRSASANFRMTGGRQTWRLLIHHAI